MYVCDVCVFCSFCSYFLFQEVFDDGQLWSLLPTLAAASFLSKSWSEADYRGAVCAYRTNLHCIALALTSLLVAMKV
jgi:hypothetical protein